MTEPMIETSPKKKSRWRQAILIVLVLGLAFGASEVLIQTAPKAEKRPPQEKQARLVTDTEVQPSAEQVELLGYGVVQAEQQVQLQAQVTGKVKALGSKFVPGASVKKGELLVALDDTDYRLELATAEAALAQAEASLASEQGNQAVAQADYDLLNLDVDEREKALILRKPQLQAAQAQVQSAQASVNRARVNLERTRITAPFDGIVVSRQTSVGALVSPTTPLGQLASNQNMWIQVALPQADLQWIDFPKGDQAGSDVCVSDASSQTSACHPGKVLNLQGFVQDNGRQAQVLVEVPLGTANPSAPALLIDQYVKVRFAGKTLTNVYKLDPSYVHSGKVWLNNEGLLGIQPVTEVFRSQTMVLIGEGLSPGQRIVTSNLSAPIDGMKIRTTSAAEKP